MACINDAVSRNGELRGVGDRAAHEKWLARRSAFRVSDTSEQTGRSERESCITRSASQRIGAALTPADSWQAPLLIPSTRSPSLTAAERCPGLHIRSGIGSTAPVKPEAMASGACRDPAGFDIEPRYNCRSPRRN
jgi:hypothetical protein